MTVDGLEPLPPEAVWCHHSARDAVEVVHADAVPDGWVLQGHTTGLEDAVPYAIAWEVVVGRDWVTRRARVRSLLPGRDGEVALERSPAGEWTVDGRLRRDLDGVLDVDLEVSAVTNTLPVHREPLDRETPSPAAYVRRDLRVELLEQWYGPGDRMDTGLRVPYRAPRFAADFELDLDGAGLVRDYPGLATRLR